MQNRKVSEAECWTKHYLQKHCKRGEGQLHCTTGGPLALHCSSCPRVCSCNYVQSWKLFTSIMQACKWPVFGLKSSSGKPKTFVELACYSQLVAVSLLTGRNLSQVTRTLAWLAGLSWPERLPFAMLHLANPPKAESEPAGCNSRSAACSLCQASHVHQRGWLEPQDICTLSFAGR